MPALVTHFLPSVELVPSSSSPSVLLLVRLVVSCLWVLSSVPSFLVCQDLWAQKHEPREENVTDGRPLWLSKRHLWRTSLPHLHKHFLFLFFMSSVLTHFITQNGWKTLIAGLEIYLCLRLVLVFSALYYKIQETILIGCIIRNSQECRMSVVCRKYSDNNFMTFIWQILTDKCTLDIYIQDDEGDELPVL